MELPIYLLEIDEDKLDSGVTAVALVDKPAIEMNWIAFNNQVKFASDKERRIISGALMVANLPIYRRDETYGEHYVMFTKETINKIVQKFFKEQRTGEVNKMHQSDLMVDGVYMFESFIIDSERGIKAPNGFESLPDGSWFGSFKVDNEEIWQNFIKTGVFKGYSIEGYFKQTYKNNQDEELIKELIDQITNKLPD